MFPSLPVAGDYEKVDFQTHLVLQAPSKEDAAVTVEFAILRDAAKMSLLIKDMVEEVEPGERCVLPIPNVDAHTLSYVLEYCRHHLDNLAKPISCPLKGDLKDELCDWDKEFLYTDLVKGGVQKEHALLIEVIKAADFMNIQPLLHLTCATMADMLIGKTPDEIREMTGLVDDISPEEHEEMKKQNRWCDE
jgi:S-phase kinase-associated protein 1